MMDDVNHEAGAHFAMLGDAELACLSRGQCPACGMRGFVLGPRGGLAQNIECADLACRSRYNVTMIAGRAVMAHDLYDGRAGPPWPSEPPK